MDSRIVIFAALLLVVAVLSKVIGCGLGARIFKYSKKESLQIGVGMISRGEVALIVAAKGAKEGLMDEIYFAPLIIVIIITTLITPILLKVVFKKDEN